MRILKLPKRGFVMAKAAVKIHNKFEFEKKNKIPFPCPDCCVGCMLYGYLFEDSHVSVCDLVRHEEEKRCPCHKCLVKVTCVEICDDLDNLKDSLYKREKS